MTTDRSEEYLGDGLYASFDGYQFVLRAPRQDGDHWVALEPSVLQAFDRYRADIEARYTSTDREGK